MKAIELTRKQALRESAQTFAPGRNFEYGPKTRVFRAKINSSNPILSPFA